MILHNIFVLDMDDELMLDTSDSHHRTIIHIDIDCFYAQVEELRDPSLKTKPVGIQQKNIIVTGNYVARSFGVGKLMLLSEALKLCPDLVLVKGEDLTNYRKMSARIFDVLHSFTPNVEKLGFDENFLDVTDIIGKQITELPENTNMLQPEGFLYPVEDTGEETFKSCSCGCETRLILGTHLAKKIRNKLFTELGITSCAGVAHNKILAKMVGSKNKPNKQTVFVPTAAQRFMRTLNSVRQIPGIGEKTENLLAEMNVKNVADLQDIEQILLQKKFGLKMAVKLKEWSTGRDCSVLKPSGKPKSIGLEDSCRPISVRTDIEEKFRVLLIRLIEQVADDGRIPIVIKIILRKSDAIKKSSHRESKQANILPSMFKQLGDGKLIITDGAQDKLLKIVMRLFERSVDLKKPFNITLLGLSFSKFQERKKGSRSIANFLIKKSEVEVQSITSLSSDGFSPNNSSDHLPRYITASPMHMDFESISDTSHASCSSDVSESEIEPSPKKTRIGLLIAKRRCFATTNDSFDAASPSKLRVGDLRLNSRELERDAIICSSPISSRTPGSLSKLTQSTTTAAALIFSTKATSPLADTSNISGISAILPNAYPSTVDPNVFKELPMDVQQELIEQWRSPASGSNSNSTSKIVTRSNNSVSGTATSSTPTTSTKTNTLHRYFIANKQH